MSVQGTSVSFIFPRNFVLNSLFYKFILRPIYRNVFKNRLFAYSIFLCVDILVKQIFGKSILWMVRIFAYFFKSG